MKPQTRPLIVTKLKNIGLKKEKESSRKKKILNQHLKRRTNQPEKMFTIWSV